MGYGYYNQIVTCIYMFICISDFSIYILYIRVEQYKFFYETIFWTSILDRLYMEERERESNFTKSIFFFFFVKPNYIHATNRF